MGGHTASSWCIEVKEVPCLINKYGCSVDAITSLAHSPPPVAFSTCIVQPVMGNQHLQSLGEILRYTKRLIGHNDNGNWGRG